MRTLEIKKIGPGSAFRFFFVAGWAGCILTGIALIFIGVSLQKLGFQLDPVTWRNGPLQIGATICGLILGSIGYGLFSGLIGMLSAWIYNCIAAHTGGIVIRVND